MTLQIAETETHTYPAGSQVFTTEIEGQTLEIASGRLAPNAAAACTIRYGDTMLLVTVCHGDPRPGIDFFPLTVDFEERMYAIGKIPGSFFRREGRPGTDATLAARMTDRPIRPLFPKGYKREVQVVCMLLTSDREQPGDVLGTIGASTVLNLSELPFEGPVSSVRVARVDGEFKAFPTYAEIEESDIDLIVAGTEDSVVMLEAGAKQVPEEEVIEAIEYAEGVIAQVNALQREVIAALGQDKISFEPPAPDRPGARLDDRERPRGPRPGDARRDQRRGLPWRRRARRAGLRRADGRPAGRRGVPPRSAAGPQHRRGPAQDLRPRPRAEGRPPRRRPSPRRPPRGHLRGGRAAAGAWQRALPARRDAGAQRRHPRCAA